MTRQQFISYIESNQRALRRFLTALCCGDSSLADDIAQETLMKAYLNCDNFRQDSKFSTWIYRIAYNTFISSRRRERVTDPISCASELAACERADKSFEYQHLYKALDDLSEKERTAILLFYMQGYDISEIAEITETSADTVKQHLSRGRRHLRALLTED